MKIKLNHAISPRAWQKAALARWEAGYRGVIRVVTGGGKTIFAQLCIESFLRKFENGQIFIIVPTVALLDQWAVSLQEGFGLNENDIACYSGTEKPKHYSIINIIVINSARTIAQRINFDIPSMLIVDECHRSGSQINSNALQGQYLATLGLSATPEREFDDGFETRISPVLGPIIYDYSYSDAAIDGIISRFSLHNVKVEMLSDELKDYNKITRKIAVEHRKIVKGIGSEVFLKRYLQSRARIVSNAVMRIPVAVKIAEQHVGDKIIIFHERVDAANKIYSILKSRMKSVTIYHTGINSIIRRDNLRLYRNGVHDILVCCRSLDEGIDIPSSSIAIIASSTSSKRQRIQRLGRVLRPAVGKDFAQIYTLYATDSEEKKLVDESKLMNGICDVFWIQAVK